MIHDLCERDLTSVEEIEHAVFSSPWKHEHFLYELNENPFAFFKVIKKEKAIIGYMDYWITFECCQLNKIVIHPDFRKQGYAKKLINRLVHEALCANCAQIMLEVRISNVSAQSLYKQYNFMQVNIRKGYYQDNHEDALIMVKPLGGITL